jgi:hypothetical protein
MSEEYYEPTDVKAFCRTLRDAWELTPELRFHEVLLLVFNGYSLDQLSPNEMMALMDEYLLQNQ